jgi:oligopeptide/dipeptide ABC transporter, ATP-binding protein, C-terminal domain
MADRVMVMYAGCAVEVAGVFDLFHRPRHPYTRGLLGSLARLDDTGQERLVPIAGAPPSLVHRPSGCAFHPRCRFARPVCREEAPALRAVGGSSQCRCHCAEELEAVAVP